MASYNIPSSIQEAASQFATTVLASINSAAAETAGVEVMYFRATPDKRSQDVIFQTYTLYGVEDCPLTFKALYSDTGYDDGAITYNIMGLNFAIPMTMDIAVKTWEDVTGNDGTIPQEHDVVFIPMTRKLMEVVSMTPVKQLGGQLTSYKVNLGIYKPTRSRLVGENLRESIAKSTTNLDERFGEDIERTLKDIVDPDQLSIHTSDVKDEQKIVTPTKSETSNRLDVRSIIDYDLIVDGHTVSRSYYDMSSSSGIVVKYKKGDSFTKEDKRCLSVWVRLHDSNISSVKNIKDSSLNLSDGEYYLTTTIGKKFSIGESVILKRGIITVPGEIVSQKRIRLNYNVVKKLNKMNANWYKMPGFTLMSDNSINLLSGNDFNISIKGKDAISISYKEKETIVQLTNQLKDLFWYGFVINLGEKFSVDVYGTDNGFKRIESVSDIDNKSYDEIKIENFYMKSSSSDITNIRFYTVENTDVDKQITDLLAYNAKNDSFAIINDSVDVYLNKPYVGRQH